MRSFVRHPLGILGFYLAVTSPLLIGGLVSGSGVGAWLILPVHLAVGGGSLWWASRKDPDRRVGMALALLAIPIAYAELPWLNQALTSGYRDPLLITWERALTGFDPSRELAGRFPWVWVSEPLHFAYLSFYPAVFFPPILLAVRGRLREGTTTVLGVLIAAVVCYIAFVLFPVQGPRYFGPPEGVPEGPMRRLTLLILENGSSRGAAFPSSHMALMTAQAALALRFQPKVGVLLTLGALGVGLGAVYGGFHYSVDLAAGAVVGGLSAWVALRLDRAGPTGA
ncbi:MAG: phosphatase PAP2 family protein [Gemmatimonadota bacterium]|nr:phosphatase PAP2 family protein [Gemmatimonadota bacterium]